MAKDVRMSENVLRACWAVTGQVGMEACSVFASWCVVRKGSSHATQHSYVIIRQVEEDVLSGFVADGGFKNLLSIPDREPLAAFKGS